MSEMDEYNPQKIEAKWQQAWEREDVFRLKKLKEKKHRTGVKGATDRTSLTR